MPFIINLRIIKHIYSYRTVQLQVCTFRLRRETLLPHIKDFCLRRSMAGSRGSQSLSLGASLDALKLHTEASRRSCRPSWCSPRRGRWTHVVTRVSCASARLPDWLVH